MYGYSESLAPATNTAFNDDFQYTSLLWTLWIMHVIICFIIILNLLVSLMGDTFDWVQETLTNTRYKELCKLISENEHLFPWWLFFGSAKYIIIVSEEKADETEDSWEGKMKLLKAKMEKSSDD